MFRPMKMLVTKYYTSHIKDKDNKNLIMDIKQLKSMTGTITPVIKYDPFNKNNNSVLLNTSEKVTEFNDTIKEVSNSLTKTLYFYNAAGISAPQIGINLRIIAINVTSNFTNTNSDDLLVLINPEVVSDLSNSELVQDMEGCLSFPESFIAISRPKKVEVTYYDTLGNELRTTFTDLQARTVLHEIEHLNGKLIIDNPLISKLKKDLILNKQNKLFKSGNIDNDKKALELINNL